MITKHWSLRKKNAPFLISFVCSRISLISQRDSLYFFASAFDGNHYRSRGYKFSLINAVVETANGRCPSTRTRAQCAVEICDCFIQRLESINWFHIAEVELFFAWWDWLTPSVLNENWIPHSSVVYTFYSCQIVRSLKDSRCSFATRAISTFIITPLGCWESSPMEL